MIPSFIAVSDVIELTVDINSTTHFHRDKYVIIALGLLDTSLKGVAWMFGFQKLASLITDLSQTGKAGNFMIVDELFTVLDMYAIQLKTQFN